MEIEGEKYCVNCDKNLCYQCLSKDNERHLLLDNIVKLDKKCYLHSDKEIKGYCIISSILISWLLASGWFWHM